MIMDNEGQVRSAAPYSRRGAPDFLGEDTVSCHIPQDFYVKVRKSR